MRGRWRRLKRTSRTGKVRHRVKKKKIELKASERTSIYIKIPLSISIGALAVLLSVVRVLEQSSLHFHHRSLGRKWKG